MSKKTLKWDTSVDAERYLGRSVKIVERVIEAKKGTLGIKKLAAIDFLCNYCKYTVKYV
jgi:hypothetical protein